MEVQEGWSQYPALALSQERLASLSPLLWPEKRGLQNEVCLKLKE